LAEAGGAASGLGVVARRVGGVTLAALPLAGVVVAGHDELASHDVQLVLALDSSGDNVGGSSADTDADLVVGDKVHPLLVEDVGAGDVGGDVAADGVALTGGAVWVEFASVVAVHDANFGEVAEGHDLDVERGADKVDGGEGAVGDDTCIVAGFCAVSDGLGFDVADGLACAWWAESAPVVD